MSDTFIPSESATLPAPVPAYLDAHDAHRFSEALALFAPDAVVHDDGNVYTGTAEIRGWLENATTEYTFTATRLGQQATDPARPVVQIRLDGDFPGGTALVHYRFELDDERIARLSIGA